MADPNYIDTKGYYIDDDRCIRRISSENGEQAIILKATTEISDAEWQRLNQAILDCIVLMR